MNVHDYSKRVKKLISRSYKQEVKECKLIKVSTICHEKIVKFQECIRKNQRKLEADRIVARKMEESNNKLRMFIEAETADKDDKKQKELIAKPTHETEESEWSKKKLLEEMDKLHCMKMLTGILLKTSQQQSSSNIDGVILCKESYTTKWLPFHTDLTKQSHTQIQNNVCQMIIADNKTCINSLNLAAVNVKNN